jgi:hypothetical protein
MRHMQARVCVQMHHGADQGGNLSDIIDFMERMGGDAQLSQASNDELITALVDCEVTPEQRAALLARDARQMGELLGTPPVCIMVAPPGPPGSEPSPMQPAVPPPPPEEGGDEEDPIGRSEHGCVTETPTHRRESHRA